MKPDLHTHSFYSDGTHSPQFLLERALQNEVTHLAITDHDCLEGYWQAHAGHHDPRLTLIPGVEISTSWENLEIHVLGLAFRADDTELVRLLAAQQQRRRERIEAFEAKLVKAGITGLGDYIKELPCVSPGRAHVARFLATRTRSTAKKSFRSLARNGRFHVRGNWCSLAEAITAVRAAGGIAVLAHPHRYPLNRKGLHRLLTDFRGAGGEGLEISCSGMVRTDLDRLAQLSLEHQLWVSSGSDFHSADASWMDIGRLHRIPDPIIKNAIWTHPRWHFS